MDFSANVSSEKARKLGLLFRKLQPKAEDFLDERFFPSPEEDSEDVARFFFFITGIDHRTSPLGQSFEGFVDGEYFQGADLLWHLALRKYREDPGFFEPRRMARITAKDIQNWLTVNQPVLVTIRNPSQRAELLRDCGQKLADFYNGSVLTLLDQAENKLLVSSSSTRLGLLDHLARFKAYEDPVRKKSFLLLKFLLRRRLWTLDDPENLRIPVDNHLIRIALRTGIVKVSSSFGEVLRARRVITVANDVALRQVVADAFVEVARHAKQLVLELDDFLWHFGRLCCTATSPICNKGCSTHCFVATNLLPLSCELQCPLGEVCTANSKISLREIQEPTLDTWYY